jgi:hypothetical protein
MKLDAEGSRAIAGLLREYGNLLCELSATRVMIKFCAMNQTVPPADWRHALEEMKKKSGYRAPSEVLETIAVRLEQDAAEIDLTELLKTLPKGSPIQ